MKKILLALMVLATTAVAANAQEVAISYGAYTQMDAMNCHKGFPKVNTAWGGVNFSLYIPVAKGIKVGPSYSYSSAYTPASEYEISGYPELGVYSLKSKVGYHTLMLNCKVDYYQNSVVKLYGHAGVGAVISHMMPKGGDSYNKGYFAFQVNPIGAEVEFMPNASIFGELGFGAQGLIQVGAKYAF